MRAGGLLCSSSALLLSLAICNSASAAGFFINQQSVVGMGRVDAGNTAAADEPATIFYNPAGLIQLFQDSPDQDFQSSFNMHLVLFSGEVRNTGAVAASPGTLGAFAPYGGPNTEDPIDPTPIPNLYLAKKLTGGRAAVGVGINAPFGLATGSSSDWFGRYDAIKASLTTVNVSVVGAYQINSNFSIGVGVDAQYAKAKLVTAIPDPLAPGGPSVATDARAETTGDVWTPGFNVGLFYTPEPDTRIGLHYRSGMTHKLSGSTAFTGFTGPLAGYNGDVGTHADFKLPAIVTLGLWHKVGQLVLLGEFEWDDWSTFETLRIRFDDGRPEAVRPTNYRDAYSAAIGAEYALRDLPVIARTGIHYDTTPTVDAFRDTTVPDSERVWLGVGATYRFSPRKQLDFSFNHVFFRDTSIGVTRTFFDGTPLATAVQVNGAVKTSVNSVAIDYRYAF